MATPTRSFRSLRRAALFVASMLVMGCAGHRLAVVGPVADAEGAATGLSRQTGLEEPLQIVFGWQLNESGQRVGGRGVARVEPPYRARLDMFLDNGESVISAALVDGELRLPKGAPADILPPADLLWGALGIFRPGEGTVLIGGDRLEGEAMRLRYRYGDETELHYQVMGGLLRSLEVLDGERVLQRVDLEPDVGGRYPVEATYRNLGAFRELRLVRESLRTVAPFDPDIWDPTG